MALEWAVSAPKKEVRGGGEVLGPSDDSEVLPACWEGTQDAGHSAA